VSSYAFVNPVVAVLLRATLAGEPLTLATALAAAVIVASVALLPLRPSLPRAAAWGALRRRLAEAWPRVGSGGA
jgi:drug/metabolite transporter (DMT)-like permease